MKYIKITCPCKRPHAKKYDDEIKYIEDECNKLLGFIGEESEDCDFAFYCSDCKKSIFGNMRDSHITITAKNQRIQTNDNQTVVII